MLLLLFLKDFSCFCYCCCYSCCCFCCCSDCCFFVVVLLCVSSLLCFYVVVLLSKEEQEKGRKKGEAKNGNNFLSKSKGAVMFAILEIIGFWGGGCRCASLETL